MKKGYNVILNLNYRTEVEFETDEEDEEKIKIMGEDEAKAELMDRGVCDELLDLVKAVNIERNYSEDFERHKSRIEARKDYMVEFVVRYAVINTIVKATEDIEAIKKAEEDLSLRFTSDDGDTECEVFKYECTLAQLADWETED